MDVLHGTAHGNIIELDAPLAVPDGSRVDVVVTTAPIDPNAPLDLSGLPEGIRQAFGVLADEAAELDEYLAVIRQHRKVGRREVAP